MSEAAVRLPPWSKKRRIVTAVVMSGFILLASGFIGFGSYQIGVELGWLKPPLNKDTILTMLLHDAQFLQATHFAAEQRTCVNQTHHFSLSYMTPLHPIRTTGETACLQFVTPHPTGATTTISFQKLTDTKQALAIRLVQGFSFVQTNTMANTHYETTTLAGLKKGIQTTLYIIAVKPDETWVVTYSPTSPVFDPQVNALIQSFTVLE